MMNLTMASVRLQVPPMPTAIQVLNAISVLVDYIETGKFRTNCEHIASVLPKLRQDVERISNWGKKKSNMH